MCVCAWGNRGFVHMSVSVVSAYEWSRWGGQKRVLDPLQLDLQAVVILLCGC